MSSSNFLCKDSSDSLDSLDSLDSSIDSSTLNILKLMFSREVLKQIADKAAELKITAAKDYLKRNRYEFVTFLGSGRFSSVLAVKNQYNEKIAAKVVKKNLTNAEEIRLWPFLIHQNIIPLLNILEFDDSYIFTMPIQNCTLETMITDPVFLNKEEAFCNVRRWFKDILMGQKYLQSHNISHLDLKTNNILISEDDRAMITDFTCLTRSAKPVNSYGAPSHLRPPEACVSWGKFLKVEGFYFDSWTTGMMFLECLTQGIYGKVINEVPVDWVRDVYIFLRVLLSEKHFYECVSLAFPSTNFSNKDLKTMRNFILMFLQFIPKNRPSAKKALSHKFLKGKRGISYKVDPIWKREANSNWMNDFIFQYHIKLLFKPFTKDCKCQMCMETKNSTANNINRLETSV